MKCVGCLKEFSEPPTAINDRGDVMCPVCTFIVALYTENGVNKRFTEGGLMVHKVSNNIRKAVNLFLTDRKQAYSTYLPKLLQRMDGVSVTDAEMDALLDESFPFLKVPIDKYKELNVKAGDEIYARSPDGRSLCRRVYATRHFTGQESRTHHYGRKAFVACFVPATM